MVVLFSTRDRAGEHPQAHLATYTGIFQADAYSGYGKLYSEAIQLGSKNAWAFYNRGQIKQIKGDRIGGAADISTAKQLDPTIGN